MRTRFSDNHKYNSNLNVVRDYFKAAHATKNFTAAKTNCTDMLSMCLQCKPHTSASISRYYTFAATVASGLSNCAANTSFEVHEGLLKDEAEVELARRKLCLLMDIIFSKISMFRFLVDEEGSNTFRVAYCRSKCNEKDKSPFVFAVFSFLMQLCLTAYVVAESITEGFEAWSLRNLPLAILTLIYSSMLVYPSLRDKEEAYRFYGNKVGVLLFMDFFVNHTLSIVLVFAGFTVIMIQESFIEAVLNSAALLFIPEIDDQVCIDLFSVKKRFAPFLQIRKQLLTNFPFFSCRRC